MTFPRRLARARIGRFLPALLATIIPAATTAAPPVAAPRPAARATDASPVRPPAATAVVTAADPIRDMQVEAERSGVAPWGHWGDQPDRYDAWSNHSNRCVPVYTFGLTLDAVRGPRSVYRDAARLRALYGRDPDATLDPAAEHFDQTDIHRLMVDAAGGGARRIVLFVFDGLDWRNWRDTRFGLQRLRLTGVTAFEYHSVHATPDGLVVTYTRPVDAAWAADPANFTLRQWRYEATEQYGGPKIDEEAVAVERTALSEDGRSVALEAPGISAGRVVYLRTSPTDAEGAAIWATEAWYTMNAKPTMDAPAKPYFAKPVR